MNKKNNDKDCNIKSAWIAAFALIIGALLGYITSSRTIESQEAIAKIQVGAQEAIAKIQVNSQKDIESNKLTYEYEKYLTEYIMKNAKNFTDEERESMLKIISNNHLTQRTIDLMLFIIFSIRDKKERDRLAYVAEKSIKKNLIKTNENTSEKMRKTVENLGATQAVGISSVLSDVLNALTINKNRCYVPTPVFSIKSTYMYNDSEMNNQVQSISPNTKVILIDANEKSFLGKLNDKEGYFRIDDFRKPLL